MIKRKNVILVICLILFSVILSLGCPEINLGTNNPSSSGGGGGGGATPETGTVPYTTPGTYSWIPQYNCNVVITVVGAGGGGGYSYISIGQMYGLGGQAGEVINQKTLSGTFLKGSTYTVIVGEGGDEGTNDTDHGKDGGSSSFNGTEQAGGGNGGLSANSSDISDATGQTNGTGYGTGGDGNNSSGSGPGSKGDDGYVKIEWTEIL